MKNFFMVVKVLFFYSLLAILAISLGILISSVVDEFNFPRALMALGVFGISVFFLSCFKMEDEEDEDEE